MNNNADLIQEDYSPYTLEGALKTNEINSIYRNTYPYVGLFNNTVKGGNQQQPPPPPKMEDLATIVPPLQLKKGLDRQLMVPTPDQEGFQKLEINEDFEDADVDKLESLVYPKGARQTGVGQH